MSLSGHPGIPNGVVVEVCRDNNTGENGDANSMLCIVMDDRPWRTIEKRPTPGDS